MKRLPEKLTLEELIYLIIDATRNYISKEGAAPDSIIMTSTNYSLLHSLATTQDELNTESKVNGLVIYVSSDVDGIRVFR